MIDGTIVDFTTRRMAFDKPDYYEFHHKHLNCAVPIDSPIMRMEEIERRVYEGVRFHLPDGRDEWLYFNIEDVMREFPWIEGIINKRVAEQTENSTILMWEARRQARKALDLEMSWRWSKLFQVFKFFYNVRRRMNRL